MESEDLSERNGLSFVSQGETAELREIVKPLRDNGLSKGEVDNDDSLLLYKLGKFLDRLSGLWVELIKESDHTDFFYGSVHVHDALITSSEDVLPTGEKKKNKKTKNSRDEPYLGFQELEDNQLANKVRGADYRRRRQAEDASLGHTVFFYIRSLYKNLDVLTRLGNSNNVLVILNLQNLEVGL